MTPTPTEPPENFRARRFWDSLLVIACVLAFLLFIFFLVDGFNSIPVT